MTRNELDAVVRMIDTQIDATLKGLQKALVKQRETNNQYDERAELDKSIMNDIGYILVRQKDRRQLIKENI